MSILITSSATPSADERIGASQVVYVATATYDDGSSGNFTYSLASKSSNDLSINASTGEVTLSSNPDFETTPVYAFIVSVTDGALTQTLSVQLSINDAQEGSASYTSTSANEIFVGDTEHDVVNFNGDIEDYSITRMADGRFLVDDLDVSDGDDGTDIVKDINELRFNNASRYIDDVFVSTAKDTRVNDANDSSDERPSIAALSNGGYVTVWTNDSEILARLFDADGKSVSDQIQVNTTTDNTQDYSDVAGSVNGGFVVVWSSSAQDGSGWGIYAQAYDNNGAKVGTELLVNTYTSNDQNYPSITALTGGGYVVSWSGYSSQGSSEISAQLITDAGALSGSEFAVNTNASSTQKISEVASLEDGGFIVVYESYRTNAYNINAQRFDASGNKVGSEILVTNITSSSYDLYRPSVAGLTDGGYVISWESRNSSGDYDVYAKRYDALGQVSKDEFKVNAYVDYDQNYSKVVATQDGGYVITWQSYSNLNSQDWDVVAAQFNSEDDQIASESVVSSISRYSQLYADVTLLNNGSLAFAWSGYGNTDVDDWDYEVSTRVANSVTAVKGSSLDDLIEDGIGDEAVNGAAGYNTFSLNGSIYDYIVTRLDDGGVLVRSIVGTPNVQDGDSLLYNIQKLVFEDDGSFRELDDVSSVKDAANPVLAFGETFSGQIYRNDQDWFRITNGPANGKVVVALSGDSTTKLSSQTTDLITVNDSWQEITKEITLDANGEYSLSVSNTSLNLNVIKGYQITAYRIDSSSTDGNDTITAGTDYEYLTGGKGNDTLIGSDRDQYLDGGEGNDIIYGGAGRDVIVGGDGTNDKDIAVFVGDFSDYEVTVSRYYVNSDLGYDPTQVSWKVENKSTGVIDLVTGVEILRFDDQDYVVDDWDYLTEQDLQSGITVNFGLGDRIEGRYNLQEDRDSIPFNFGDSGVVNDTTTLKITIGREGVRNDTGRVQFINATGSALQMYNVETEETVDYLYAYSYATTYLVKGIQWGEFGEGGPFGGRTALIQFYSSGVYGYDLNSNPLSSDANEWGKYNITISRHKDGTSGDDQISAQGATEAQSVESISGLAGNDTITGRDAAEVLDGGSGDDTIQAYGGNDTLVGGTGIDLLYGGTGDDIFIVSGETAPKDLFDGGAGTDTLKITGNVDFSDATFASLEKIEGESSRITLTPSQLASIQSMSGVYVSGSEVDAANVDGDFVVIGTTGDDVIKTGDGDNVVIPYTGSETIDLGDGNDILSYGYNSQNTSWDYQYRASYNLGEQSSADFSLYSLDGAFSGGVGEDTLLFNLHRYLYIEYAPGSYGSLSNPIENGIDFSLRIDISAASISGFEKLEVKNDFWSSNNSNFSTAAAVEAIYLNASQVSSFNTLSGADFIVSGGGVIDLSSITLLDSATLSFVGDDDYTITGSAANDVVRTYGGDDVISTGDSSDTINAGKGVDTVSAGAGNDKIIINDESFVQDSIDGGEGTDTLQIFGGAVDLSEATLTSIESIEANSTSLALTQAQYTAYSSILSGSAGLILKVDGAGIKYVSDLPAGFVGIQGDENANQLVGSDNADILAGGAGSDTLTGGDGADTLVAGEGVDTLSGGLGADILDVRGKAVVSDRLSGGAGLDTLLVEDGQNLTGATLVGIETIKGTGTITLSPTQLADVTKLDGVSVQLANVTGSFVAPDNLILAGGASIYLPEPDSEISATAAYIGSTSDDVITGTSSADKLYGGRGADEISGGAGDDLIVGGKGTDTLIGGVGDDTFLYTESDWGNSNTVYSDLINGGDGNDTIELSKSLDSHQQYEYYINNGSMTNVENIDLTGRYWRISLNADQFESLDEINLDLGTETNAGYFGRLIVREGKYQDLTFDALNANEWLSIRLEGKYGDLDISANALNHTDLSFSTSYSVNIDSLDSLVGSSSEDWVYIGQDYDFSADLGAGDDILQFGTYGNAKFVGSIDGGDGSDLVRIGTQWEWDSYLYDLTSATFTNVESIYYGSNRLVVTEAQLSSLSFDGSGAVYTLSDAGIVQGSSGDDSYSGNGVSGSFAGGKGDDTISNLKTVYFSGNYADYNISIGRTTTVEADATGSLSDGTDTLTNVQQLVFADTQPGNEVIIDDAPDELSFFLGDANSSARALLDETPLLSRQSYVKNYSNDVDVFRTTFVPNSPFDVEASVKSGNGLSFQFYDADTGQNLRFYSLKYGWTSGGYYTNWMDKEAVWLPQIYLDNQWQAYEGGEVVYEVGVNGEQIEDYAFTFKYYDDYAGSAQTLGVMDANDGVIRGYIGDKADQDWIRTELVGGTKYEFKLLGVSNSGGSLNDPLLKLYDASGRLISTGIPLSENSLDDSIIFRPDEENGTGTYYLAVSDVIGESLGSWTLTQESLDVVADNVTTTGRVEWSPVQRFSITNEINSLTDHDWFKVWLDKGITYTFELTGDTLADPALTLRSASGRLLRQNDNADGADSEIVYSAIDSGWYFLDAGAAGNMGKGTYVLSGSTLADDYSNDIFTTGSASVGAEQLTRGIISYIGDSDWISVGLSANTTYVITLNGDITDLAQMDPLLDPLLIIRDETGKEIERIDDSNGSLNAVAYFTPDAAGKYFLEAKSSFKYDIGSYSLNVALAPPDDHKDTFDSSATALTLGENFTASVSGNVIGIPGDKDVFSISMTANKVYLLEMSGLAGGGGTLIDPYLRVFDSAGHLLDFNNNGGTGNDAKFYFVPSANGTYYIEASANNDQGRGTYTLNVSERNLPPDDFANDVSTSSDPDALIVPGESKSGTLLTSNDEDWFVINLVKGEDYVFRAKASASGSGTLDDPVLELRDSNGQLLKQVAGSDRLAIKEPAFAYTATDSGKYYLVVKAKDGQVDTGSYTLITRAPDDHSNASASATDVSLNEVVSGIIQYNDGEFGVRAYDSIGLRTDFDEDWFAFNANANTVMSVQVQIADGSALSRPLVEVVDSNGRTMAIGDGLETDNGLAAATFLAENTGKYYARVIDGAGATGEYSLTVVIGDSSDEDAQGPKSIAFVDDGTIVQSVATGVISLTGDQDTYSIALQDGHSYRIETAAVRDGSTAPLGTATLNMLWKPDGSGDQAVDVFTKTWTDNNDGTHTLKLFIDPSKASDWQASGLEAFTASLNVDQTVLGDFQGVSYPDSGFGDITESTDGSTIEIEAFFYPGNFEADGLEPIAELLFADPAGGAAANANAATVTAVTFDERTIDPVVEQGAPTAFEEGAFTATGDGTLEITLAPSDVTQTGKYQLRVIDLGTASDDDHVDLVSEYSGDVLAINDSSTGKIDVAGDKDLFAVNLTVGNIYDFSVKSYFDGLGTLGKAALRLVDTNGSLVSSGTYDADTGRTELAVSVFTDGKYYLEVSAVDLPGNTGTYVLDTRDRGSVTNTNDDYASDSGTSTSVSPGNPITGEIEVAGDNDWLSVALEAGKVYVFDVLADGDGPGGTLSDSTLRLLDAEGNEIAFDDDSGAALDSHIQFTANATGTYYLDVGSNKDSIGTYTLRVRELYSGVADPLRAAQWYLDATHIDELNGQYTGAGVSVAVVDDGIDATHPDLQENYSFADAFDTQFDTQDGTPKYPLLIGAPDDHGTAVAGIIAAVANNETGIQGAASDVDLVSTRVHWSWADMTQAINLQYQFDVSNNSWGAILPFGDNFNSTDLTFAWVGLRKGVEDGRAGKGTVFIFSAGNSAGLGDNTNYHNFQNAREVITVGAIDQDNTAAGFSTPGANVLVGTYGVGMITTDRHQPGWGYNKATLGDYYSSFTGTSASAPLLSGIVAMMLEANPDLGYRDVQKILAYSSTHPDVQDWKFNAASDFNLGGLRFNDKSGFGVVDAYAAVQLAESWTTQNTSINEVSASARKFGMSEAIPDGNGDVYTKTFEIDSNMSVEHVELGIDIRHSRLGDLIIKLISPNGTVSVLMDRPTVNAERPFGLTGDDSGVPNHLLWDFSSVQFWGEDASGTWTIQIEDVRAEEKGTLQSLSLRIYGENNNGNDVYVFTDEGFEQQIGSILEDEYGVDTINAAPVRHDMYVDIEAGIIAANATAHGIADWTTIENIVTGAGDDRLVGNDEDNILTGNAGDDQFEGGLGNDTISGGQGADVAVYQDTKDHYSISWNPNTETLTVVDLVTSNGDEGTDTLTGVERLVFADAEMSLGETVGNHAPVAKTSFFDTPLVVGKGMGIDFQLPEDAFSDADGDANTELSLKVEDPAGGNLPDWLSFDPKTGQFTGVPPEDFQGQLKLLVTATDEYGESVSDELTLQFGDNQAPVIDAVKEIILDEDGELKALGLSLPYDPEGTVVTIEITELPTFGQILDKAGNVVSVGSTLSADELTELFFKTSLDSNGDAGYLRYKATDEDNVSVSSGVKIFVDPVNDAPRFATQYSQLLVNYPAQANSVLTMEHPTDPESTISTVKVIGLPEIGSVTLDTNTVSIDDVLTFDQLDRLVYTISEEVNGPVGAVTIQAVDDAGAATNWALNIVVQNENGEAQGTAGNDELFGSVAIDILYGLGGNDYIVGNAGDDRLLGGLGNDRLFGGGDDDRLDGSAGNDYLDGGTGSDILAGGPGNDTYIVDSAGDQVLEIIGGGAGGDDLVVSSIDFTLPDNVESLTAAAGSAIDLTGNALDNILIGNDENNVLTGNQGRDILLGQGGDDTLIGGTGVDRLVGGEGDDTYYVDSRSDRIVELANQGTDTVYASSSYTLYSNLENLVLQGTGDFSAGGNSLDNHLKGNSGNNVLAGGIGADILEGGLGDDIYVLSDDRDTIIDTGGIDTIRSTMDVSLVAGIENAQLVGIENTTATGTTADNVLEGNLGNNTLDGKGGVDILTGGGGGDSFILAYNGDGKDADTVTDFMSGEDLLIIDLASFDIDVASLGLTSSGLIQSDSFVSRAGAIAVDPDDYFIYDSAQGMLMFDADGSGSTAPYEVARIILDPNSAALNSSDVFIGV